MDNKLREYFPLIRTREELLAEIESDSTACLTRETANKSFMKI